MAIWYVARRASRGQQALPPRRVVPVLVAAGLFMQLAGNVSFQWALGEIGLAVTVPLVFGALIIGGAVCGRVVLSEGITSRSAVAMLLLIVAVTLLSVGAEQANAAVALGGPSQRIIVALACGAACLAGLAYAVCNVVIRRVATGSAPLSGTLLILSTTGFISLGVLTFARIGPAGIAATTLEQWGVMIAAGVFNAVAFFSLGRALQIISIVHANTLNASQVAMCAVAGIVLFDER